MNWISYFGGISILGETGCEYFLIFLSFNSYAIPSQQCLWMVLIVSNEKDIDME